MASRRKKMLLLNISNFIKIEYKDSAVKTYSYSHMQDASKLWLHRQSRHTEQKYLGS